MVDHVGSSNALARAFFMFFLMILADLSLRRPLEYLLLDDLQVASMTAFLCIYLSPTLLAYLSAGAASGRIVGRIQASALAICVSWLLTFFFLVGDLRFGTDGSPFGLIMALAPTVVAIVAFVIAAYVASNKSVTPT